jgi:hypothetical protein
MEFEASYWNCKFNIICSFTTTTISNNDDDDDDDDDDDNIQYYTIAPWSSILLAQLICSSSVSQ